MALLLVGAVVRGGVKVYKAYDKKQKQKKEQNHAEENGLNLNDPSVPSSSTLQTSGGLVPRQYRDEKKSREYQEHNANSENPFDSPPSYDRAIEQSSTSSSSNIGYSSEQLRSIEHNHPQQQQMERRDSESSSGSSGSSNATDDLSQRRPGLSRSEYKALRRQMKFERRLERRQLKAERRAYRAGFSIGEPVLRADYRNHAAR